MKKPTELLRLYSTREHAVEFEKESWYKYRTETACPTCQRPSREWDASPEPINIFVSSPPSGSIDIIPALGWIYARRFRDALRPFMGEHVYWGKVRCEGFGWLDLDTWYHTCWAPRSVRIEADRSKYARHCECPKCGCLTSSTAWANPVVLSSQLDDRRVYIDHSGWLFIDDALYHELNMRQEFPDIRGTKVPVVSAPQDGEVLPGDPGWQGTFVRNASKPEVPIKDKPLPGYSGLW